MSDKKQEKNKEKKQEKEIPISERIKENPVYKGIEIQDQLDSPYRLVIDSMKSGIEADYFWVVRFLQTRGHFGLGMSGTSGYIEKVQDLYTAGEASSYWGNIEQRRAAQIDKVTQILQSVGGMLKSTFQILRELRILDERIEYYDGYNKADDSSSVALKSVWVDMVEGGAKNPASVLGLATQVGFVILPDLFFKYHPKDQDEVDKIIKALEKENFNRKTIEVLGRKLKQFIIWKEKTEKEVRTRKNFMLKYLRQHFNSIKLNINWLKPYLRNIGRLEFKDITADPDILKSFETAKTEVEVIGVLKEYDYTDPKTSHITTYEFQEYFPCLKITMSFVAMPQMAFQKEYQRGAIQMGRTIIHIEPIVAKKKDIDDYKKFKEQEDVEIITSLNASLDAMKEELDHYLEEAGELMKKEEKPEEKAMTEGIFEPFKALVGGFRDIFGVKEKKHAKPSPGGINEKNIAKKIAKERAFTLYDVYKKGHGMITI